MKPSKLANLVVLTLLVVVAVPSSARAQAGRRPIRQYRNSSMNNEPVISPYMNLLRGGADPGFNYYTLVQPQLQQQRYNQLQGQQIQRLGREVAAEKASPYGPVTKLRSTGTSATRMNYSHYYPGLGGAGGRGGAPARNYPSGGGGAGGMGMGGIGMY